MRFDILTEMVAKDPAAEAELKNFAARWEADGVDTWMFLDGKDITLSKIKIKPEMRGLGIGSRFMRELTGFAGERGYRILLSPSTAFGGTSVDRLKRFYSRFGFKPNAGRNKDFTTRETMIWDSADK